MSASEESFNAKLPYKQRV